MNCIISHRSQLVRFLFIRCTRVLTVYTFYQFQPSEIALVEQIGIALVKTFLVVEENLYKKHVNFQESHKQHGPKIGAVLAPVPDAEAAGEYLSV